MIDRRTFNFGLATGAVGAPTGAFAQGKVWRVGFFYFGSRQSSLDTGRFDAFMRGMRELGYVEGKNLIVEARFGDGKLEILAELAGELVKLKPDLIVATGSPVYRALQQATSTLPIVVTVSFDPVIEGLAKSLARPGGNFTGLSSTADNLGPKQLDLLMAWVPRMSRVGVLANPANPAHPSQVKLLGSAAQKVGVQVVTAQAATLADIETGFATLARLRAEGVILFGDTFLTQATPQIAQAAIKQHLPSIFVNREFPKAGGLMSYGADTVENFHRAASFVDKILKGAKPAQLAFEQPTRYLLVINLGTAHALGLSMPPSLKLRADELIQ